MPLLLGLFASNKKETDPFWRACQGLREAVLINPQEGTVPIHRVYPRLWEKKMKPQSPQSPPHSGWESGGSPWKRRGWPWLHCGAGAHALSVAAPLGAELGLQGVQVPVFAARGARQVQQADSRAEAGHWEHTGSAAPWPVGSSRTRSGPVSPALAGGFFTPWATREAQQGCCFFFFFSFLQSGLPTLEKDCLLYSPCKPFLSSQSVSVSPALSTPPPHRRGPRSGLGAGRKDGALY